MFHNIYGLIVFNELPVEIFVPLSSITYFAILQFYILYAYISSE